MTDYEILTALDNADACLTNLNEIDETVNSAINSARSAINAARAHLLSKEQ